MTTGFDLDRLCADALRRIANHVNRMAAQQARRMRESWQTTTPTKEART